MSLIAFVVIRRVLPVDLTYGAGKDRILPGWYERARERAAGTPTWCSNPDNPALVPVDGRRRCYRMSFGAGALPDDKVR